MTKSWIASRHDTTLRFISRGPSAGGRWARASFLQLRLPVGDDRDGLALSGRCRTEDKEVLPIAKGPPLRIREELRSCFEREEKFRCPGNQFAALASEVHRHQIIIRRAVEQLLLV